MHTQQATGTQNKRSDWRGSVWFQPGGTENNPQPVFCTKNESSFRWYRETTTVETGRGLHQGCCISHPSCSICTESD